MSQETNTVAWWRLLNRYQWFVLIIAAAGWLLDCMDQQLFNLARTPAMKELLKGTFAPDATPGQIAASVQEHAGYSTAIFLLGWATGGLIFGVLGDRIGRAKTMLITILMYSGCTGLSALSQAFWDFALYRFITGLGVGGEFAVGVALVAEVMPDKARPYALSLVWHPRLDADEGHRFMRDVWVRAAKQAAGERHEGPRTRLDASDPTSGQTRKRPRRVR